MFSKLQIEELDVLKELCHGVEVDGIPFVCFDVLSDIAHSKKKFSDLSLDELRLLKEQLFEYKEFWANVDWFDNLIFLEILPFLENKIEYEFLKYRA